MNTDFFSSKKPILSRFSGLKLAVLMVAGMAPGLAAAEASGSLSLSEAVNQALGQHPDLASYQYRLESAEGEVDFARLGTRKRVSLEVEDALGSGNFGGFDQAQTTLGVTWVLENDLLDAREKRARQDKTLVEVQRDIKRLDIASDTALKFVTALMYQEQQHIARQWEHDAGAMYRNIAKRVKAGKSAVADKHRARAEHALSQLALEDIEHEIQTAHKQLVALWAAAQPGFAEVQGNMAGVAPLPEFDTLLAGLENNPDIKRFLNQERVAESAITLARAESQNRWQFSTGIRHYAESDDVGLTAGLSIPLGSSKRAAPKLRSLNADIETYRSQAAALKVQLGADLFELYQAYQHARHSIEVLNEQVLPEIEKALFETRKAYDLGRSGFQDWVLIQKELLGNRMKLLQAYYLAHINRIEIERLIGASATSFSTTLTGKVTP